MSRVPTTKTPPYLSVVDSEEGPVLLLTIDAEHFHFCDECDYCHVRVLPMVVTPDVLRQFATHIRQWADRLEDVQ